MMQETTPFPFVVSSFCHTESCCVGVAMDAEGVRVTNTTAPGPVARFTHEEWKAFVLGVKNNEFDI